MSVYERALGPDHQNLGASLSDLGDACRGLGMPAEVEGLFRRSVAVLEKALGPDHPGMANPLRGWGVLHAAQGDRAAAERLLRRALAVRERVLGSDHPETVESRPDYARLLRETGRAAEAAKLQSGLGG